MDKKLYEKFDKDIAKRTRLKRLLLALDQLANVIFWNGSQDETISSHIGRKIKTNQANWFEKKLCCILQKIESKHCIKSLGE